MSDLKPQELASIAWAFATANRPDEGLFAALARTAKQRMNEGLYRGRFAFNEGRPASSGARARGARRAGAPLRHEGQHAPMGNLLSGAVNYWG